MAHAKRQAAKAAAAGADGELPVAAQCSKGGNGKGRKGARGKKQTAEPAATAGDAAAAEEQAGDGDKGAVANAEAAAAEAGHEKVEFAAASAAAAESEAAAAAEQRDIPLGADKSGGAGSTRAGRKAAVSKKDQKAAAAVKAAGTTPAEPVSGSRKRCQPAEAGESPVHVHLVACVPAYSVSSVLDTCRAYVRIFVCMCNSFKAVVCSLHGRCAAGNCRMADFCIDRHT